MTKIQYFMASVATTLLFLLPIGVRADEAKTDADTQEAETSETLAETDVVEETIEVPRLPKQWHDAGFDRYVDLDLLRRAMSRSNASLMTDAALQFAEGERILQRSHKAVKADKLLAMAVNLAAEKDHKPSLERLAKAAETLGKKQLTVMIQTAGKMAASRSASPAMSINAEQTTPDALAELQSIMREVDRAKLIGNREALAELAGRVASSELSDEQQKELVKSIEANASDLPEEDATAELLSKLASTPRTYGQRPATSGYPAQPAAGYPAAAGYPGQPQAGYPGQSQAGYPGQPQAGYPAQATAGYPGQAAPGQPAAGYPGQPAAGYPGQPAAGQPGQPAAGYPGQPAAAGYPGQPAAPSGFTTAPALRPETALPGKWREDIDTRRGEFNGMVLYANGTYSFGGYSRNLLDYQETGKWKHSTSNLWRGYDGRISFYYKDGTVDHYQYDWDVPGRSLTMDWEAGVGEGDDVYDFYKM